MCLPLFGRPGTHPRSQRVVPAALPQRFQLLLGRLLQLWRQPVVQEQGAGCLDQPGQTRQEPSVLDRDLLAQQEKIRLPISVAGTSAEIGLEVLFETRTVLL